MNTYKNLAASFSLAIGLAVSLVLIALVAVSFLPNQASAASKAKDQKANNTKQESHKNDKSKAKENKKLPNVAGKTYDYVAQPGDSYTLMARKAVQTYGIIHHVNLSGAQIIFAETNLTQQADSPYLNVGQKVSMKVPNIQGWIVKAQSLSKAQLAAWNYYVQFVNFNTDSVGESSK